MSLMSTLLSNNLEIMAFLWLCLVKKLHDIHIDPETYISLRKLVNTIRTAGEGEGFPPRSRFPANNFGSNKGTQSKVSDFS